MRSWLERLISLGTPLPEPAPEPAGVVRVFSEDRTPEESEELERRLAVVRDREQNPELTWEELGKRHGMEPSMCRYLCDRVGGKRGSRVEGDEAVLPGRAADGMRNAPQDYLEDLRRLYASPKRPGPADVYKNKSLRDKRKKLGLRLSYWAHWRHIERVLKNDPWVIKRRAAKPGALYLPFAGDLDWINKVVRPGQVIYVDFTEMKNFVWNDERTGTFRPLLLLAVDVATRLIVGWLICATTPSEADYRKLIHMILTPKADLLRRYGAQHACPTAGLMEIICGDRGWIFTAHDSRRLFAELMGVRAEHAAEFQPVMKAIVERLFGVLDELFLDRLPGATKRPERGGQHTKRAQEEAQKDGLTITELRRALTQEIVDGYHQDEHGTLGKSPVQEWEEKVALYGAPRPWPTDERGYRRLQHLRLIDGGTYKRHNGRYRFKKRDYIPSATTQASDEVRVLYDRDDPSFIELYSIEGRAKGVWLGSAAWTGVTYATWRPPTDDDGSGSHPHSEEVVARFERSRSKPERPRAAAKRQREAERAAASSPRPIAPSERIRILRRRELSA